MGMDGGKRNVRHGFTLIEMMVAIGIIMLLAGVLTPVTANALRKSKHTACASNLRQIGIALNLYAAEYDDFLPPYTNDINYVELYGPKDGTETFKSGQALVECLDPWLRCQDVWFCPSDANQRTKGLPDRIRHELTSYWYRPIKPNERPTWPIRYSLTTDTALGDRILQDAAWLEKDADGMEVRTNHEDHSVNYLRPDGGIGFVPPGR